jgi:hypothetical protein
MSGKGVRLAAVTIACVLAGVLASPALAAGGARRPSAVHAKVSVDLRGTVGLDNGVVTIPWRGIYVRGVVRPYVPRQVVHVLLVQGRKVLKHKRIRVHAGPGGHKGYFKIRVASPVTGRVQVEVIHKVTRRMSYFFVPRKLRVLAPHAGFGSRGPFVRLIQQQLSRLHLYIPQTGVYDSGTGLAMDAYHRLLGWGTYQTLDTRTIDALLDGKGTFHVRFPGHGRHAEGDLANQLLALIDGNKVYWIFPISSGKPSTPTILGDYHIYSRVPGYLPDGMYYSDFFIRGYAIHGYDPAPDYPASHGCMRLPIVDAISAFNWLALGDWVDTYY